LIDKQPLNWMVAGVIRAALPYSRILHLVRDPMDVCFSNYRAMFGNAYSWSYDFTTLARHYRSYSQLMQCWGEVAPGTILDVRYTDLVRAPEATLREVFAFCGLKWETGCDDLTRNGSPVSTLSASQVREPVHTRAVGQWQKYATHLAPLQYALGGR
jgi:hypothetical protein